MLKKIAPIIILSFAIFSFPVLAKNEYQYEGAMVYSSTDDEDFIDTTIFGVSITMFVEPVSYGDNPYNESGFLARKSNVTLFLGQIEYDLDFATSEVDIDTTAMSARGEYMLPGNSIVLGAGFTTAEGDKNYFGNNVDVSQQEASVSAGYYIDPLTRIKLIVQNSELEIKSDSGGGRTLDTDTVLLEYLEFMHLDNGDFAGVHGRVGRVEFEDVDINTVRVGGDYYFSRTTSFGTTLGYVSSDQDGVDGYSVALRFRHFVDRFTSVSLGYEQFDGDGSNGDSNTTSIRILHRY